MKRGTVIRFVMTDPDDPQIQSRPKYALIIGLDPKSPESFLLHTTSKLEKLEALRRRMPDALKEFQPGDLGDRVKSGHT